MTAKRYSTGLVVDYHDRLGSSLPKSFALCGIVSMRRIDFRAWTVLGSSYDVIFQVKEGSLEGVMKALKCNPCFDGDEEGLTPLHWACDRGHAEIVRTLLEVRPGAVNAQDFTGQTPLHYGR